MRLLHCCVQDVRYQWKYGFYLIYALLTAVYVGILRLLPAGWRETGAAVVLFSDPAMLGFFFIGGIWLLEKGEGLHGFWRICPLRTVEYVAGKVLSLAGISTLCAALITLLGLGEIPRAGLLLPGVFVGACVFTLPGLWVATYARSMNHYIILSLPVGLLLLLPLAWALLRPGFWLAEAMPVTLLLRLLLAALGGSGGFGYLAGLLLWLVPGVALCHSRVQKALRKEVEG